MPRNARCARKRASRIARVVFDTADALSHRSSTPHSTSQAMSDDEDRRAVERVREDWVRAIATRDAEALRQFLTDDYEVWAHGMRPICGPDGAIAAMRGALE